MDYGISNGIVETTDGKHLFLIEIKSEQVAEKLAELDGEEIFFEVEKWSETKSDQARKYFWKLCSLIGKSVGASKDSIYKLQLSKYGTYVDVPCSRDAMKDTRRLFKYSEVIDFNPFDEYAGVVVRGYFGISGYSKSDMRALLQGTVNDASDLGISTDPQQQIERYIEEWKPR